MPTVVAVAAERMTAVRVEGVLQPLGCPAVFAELQEGAIRDAVSQHRRGVVVLDLAVTGALRSTVYRVAHEAGVPVVAFGSQGATASLAEARRDGANDVLMRDALAHGLGPLVAKHLARAAGMPGGAPT